MHKNVLIDLLKDYEDRRDSFFGKENPRIALLKKFMTSPEIQLRRDDSNVSLVDFFSWMEVEKAGLFTELFIDNDDYLNDGSHSATLFNKFFSAEKKYLNDRGNLDNLVEDARNVFASFLSPTDFNLLSQTSSTFFKETKHWKYWKDKIIEAGCQPELIDQVIQTGKISDYKMLYRGYLAYKKINESIDMDKSPEQWEMLCLSGDPSVISFVAEREGNEKKNKRGQNILHLVCLSGSISAMRFAVENLHIDLGSIDMHRNSILDFSALSGSAEMISEVMKLDKQWLSILGKINPFDISYLNESGLGAVRGLPPLTLGNINVATLRMKKISLKNSLGSTSLHLAALSGSAEAMREVIKLDIYHLNIEDSMRNNILHYAARSGSVEAMREALKLGIDPSSVNNIGDNVLHCAVRYNMPEIILFFRRYCFEKNINITPESRNVNDKSAIDLCKNEKVRIALTKSVEEIPPIQSLDLPKIERTKRR